MRLTQLDSLRAFAILLVFFSHYGGKALNQMFPIGSGFLGVGLFFTLSGFLITGILLSGFDKGEDRRKVAVNFYARRFLRLIPPFYLVLLILVLVNLEPIASSWYWHAAYLTNIWMIFGNPMNVLWTLAVEEQFYVLWPLVIALTPRKYLLHATIATIVLATVFRLAMYLSFEDYRFARYQLFAQMDLLALGALLAIWCYRDGKPNNFDWYSPKLQKIFTPIAFACMGAAIAIWGLTGRGSPMGYFTYNWLCGIFFVWAVLHTARGWTGIIGIILNNGVLNYIGKISYGLYLVHNFTRPVLEKFTGELTDTQALPIVLAITFAVCSLSYHCIEQPILRLKKYFP